MTTPKTPTAITVATAANAKTAAVAAPTNGVAPPPDFAVGLPPLTELPDPPQIPDMPTQMPDLVRAFSVLTDYYLAVPDAAVMGNCYLAPDVHHINGSPYPDCMVAFGMPRPKQEVVDANGYTISELGKPPDFVLEVASKSTGRRDYTEKRAIYAGFGVPEYWRFDYTEGDFHDAALAGDRLTPAGRYEPIAITRTLEGVYRGYSAVLNLELHWDNGQLRFWNPDTEDYVLDITENRVRREASEAAHLATSDQLEAALIDRNDAREQRDANAARAEANAARAAANAAQRDAEAAARAEAEAQLAAEAAAHQAEAAAHQSTADQLAAAQELIRQLQAQQQ